MEYQDPKYLAKNQYTDPTNFYLRRALVNFEVPKISIKEKAIEALNLNGREEILEVGCGDGKVLYNLRKEMHTGRLVGLDISKGMFLATQKLAKKENRRIEFVESSADDLNFPDKSFDVILSFYMLYHMKDIQKTLLEWSRVLKDNGRILIATNSSKNRERLHKFKGKTARLIKSKPAPNFSSRFNLENGSRQLKRVFKITNSPVFEAKIIITEAQPYLDAMESYHSAFDPVPNELQWKNAIRKVREDIETEIKRNGKFVDKAKTGFFVCSKRY